MHLNDQKTKSEIKKELEDPITNGNENKNRYRAKNCTERKEDAAKVIHEFEEIIKNKKK